MRAAGKWVVRWASFDVLRKMQRLRLFFGNCSLFGFELVPPCGTQVYEPNGAAVCQV